MGQVAVTFRIMPEDPSTDMKVLEHEIRKHVHVQAFRLVPIGFGVSVIELLVLFDDSKGGSTDMLEQQLAQLPGVASVETTDVTLV